MATTESVEATMSPTLKRDAAVEIASNASTGAASASAVSPSPSKKRPAEDPAPSMTKDAASKALSSLKIPKLKNQSQYVRFKSLLLKDAKDRGDTETSSNITKVAKDAWAKVKDLALPSPVGPATNTNDAPASATCNLNPDMQRYLELKGRAIKDEQDEKQKYDAEVLSYSQKFLPAAVSYLQWHLIEATKDNDGPLIEATQLVKNKFQSSPCASAVDQAPFAKILKDTLAQLKHFRELKSESALTAKLRNATDEELAEHVKNHRRLLAQVAELNVIKRQKQSEDMRKREAEEEELSNADMIEHEITKALNKQMKYTNSSLKYSSVNISYRRGGVSQKVFAKAFKVAAGSKKATIRGSEVGTKWLRYGAYLECSEVNVKLVGEELVAQAKYSMRR